MPKTTEKDPKMTNNLGEPMSKMGPHDIGEAHSKKDVKVPIQAIVELDSSEINVPL